MYLSYCLKGFFFMRKTLKDFTGLLDLEKMVDSLYFESEDHGKALRNTSGRRIPCTKQADEQGQKSFGLCYLAKLEFT